MSTATEVTLVHQSYGKHSVRVSKIQSLDDEGSTNKRYEFYELSVDIELQGNDFTTAYTEGDNKLVVATDTIKNTVYVLAKDHHIASIESFSIIIATHFLKQYDHVTYVTVTIRQKLWERLLNHEHGFTGNNSVIPTCTTIATKKAKDEPYSIIVTSGMSDCVIAKTTQSGFADFHRDEYRTLPDTDDRILATSVTARWTYNTTADATTTLDYNTIRTSVYDALVATFLNHYSKSVQETLYKMASSAIAAIAVVESVTLTMPNKHHIPFNLQPFNRTNNNEIFVPTAEPYGFITATIARSN